MATFCLTHQRLTASLAGYAGREEQALGFEVPSTGRGAVARTVVDGVPFLVKPYLRGGVPGTVLGNVHFGIASFRRELRLTEEMEALELPVSKLRAVTGAGLPCWRRAFAWIEPHGGEDGFALWRRGGLRAGSPEAAQLAAVLLRFFDAGFVHADLNLGNLLHAPEGWVVLDWRGGRRSPAPLSAPGRAAQVARLARSGRKHLPPRDQSAWSAFVDGLQRAVADVA